MARKRLTDEEIISGLIAQGSIKGAKLQGNLCGAIDTLNEIMTDPEAPKQTRANCAVSILQYGAKYTEATDIIERLEAIEETQALNNSL